jgi:phage tail-like protein
MLPEVFRDAALAGSEPLSVLLDVMVGLTRPSDEVLAAVHTQIDPRRCKPELVPLLARWMAVDHLLEEPHTRPHRPDQDPLRSGLGRLRELIAGAATLSRQRGTARGLKLYLELVTGVVGFEIHERVRDARGPVRPFHVVVLAPGSTRPLADLLRRIIETEKPAFVTCELTFGA